jgi:Ca2+-binding EF-hand superfamily protein
VEITEQEVSELMKAADANSDGKIDFEEFVSMMMSDEDPQNKDALLAK